MKKLVLLLIVISINFVTKGQDIIDQFNDINNMRKAENFILDYQGIIPQKHYRIIDSQYDSTSQDQILLSLEIGDTVTLKQYLNKIVQSQTYTSCFAESFRLNVPFDDRIKADSILEVILKRLGNGELFSEIGREYSVDNEVTLSHEYRLYDNEESEFTRTILQKDSGEVCLVPYTIGSVYCVVKKTSANVHGKVNTAFRLYKSDYCELLPVKTTIFRYYDEKNELKFVFKKENSGNSIIYTRFTFPEYSISREILTIKSVDCYYNPDDIWQSKFGSDETELKTISYEFFKCNETSKIRKAKSPERFVKRNDHRGLLFNKYNMLVFSVRNDSLFREDISGDGVKSHLQLFKYCDSLVSVFDYSIMLDTISVKKAFIINSYENGKMIKSQWVGTNKFNKNSYKPTPTTEQFSNDSVRYSDIEFYYNNEPQWLRILDMIRIEGPVYINVIQELDTKLFSWVYSYKSGTVYTTDLKKDKQGRIIEIVFKKNGEIYKRCKIEYRW